MNGWNFDIEQAPKGHTETVRRKVGKVETEVSRHVPALIIAAGNGGVVTISRWIPDAERWNMFSKDTPPLAWMPCPAHPNAEAAE